MSKTKSKPTARAPRRACNLTLSEDARNKAETLKGPLVRESVSSVVEFLIVSKHRELFPAKGQVVA